MLHNATPLRKSAPGPPNSSDEHVSCTAPATENASLQILFTCPTPAILFEMLQNPHVLLTFDKVHNPLRLPRKTTLQRPKVAQIYGQYMVLCRFWLRHVLRATTACTFSTSQLLKVVRSWSALFIFTWKCAARHNGVHFFDIATSKSALNSSAFNTFDLEMCFSPQRRAIFHLSSGQLAPQPPL